MRTFAKVVPVALLVLFAGIEFLVWKFLFVIILINVCAIKSQMEIVYLG